MKLLFDLFPVILFFTAFKYSEKHPETASGWLSLLPGMGGVALSQAPILVATVVVILATVGQIAWVWHRHGKVDKMLWFSLVLVVVFGSLTLIFQDENFIKWKPTILYWAFAVSMTVSALVFHKNAIRSMLGEQIRLPDAVWGRLNASWVAFFAFMGAANLYIAFNFPTDVWVDFKLFGGMGLMLVFVLAQGFVLSRYMEESE